MDGEPTHCGAGLFLKGSDCRNHSVALVQGDGVHIGRHFNAIFLGLGQAHLIAQLHGLHHRLDVMIPILANGQHIQGQIDFGLGFLGYCRLHLIFLASK